MAFFQYLWDDEWSCKGNRKHRLMANGHCYGTNIRQFTFPTQQNHICGTASYHAHNLKIYRSRQSNVNLLRVNACWWYNCLPIRMAAQSTMNENTFVLTPSRTRRFSSAASICGRPPDSRNIFFFYILCVRRFSTIERIRKCCGTQWNSSGKQSRRRCTMKM